MLMTGERRPTIRTLRGWAISVLQEAGAIRECTGVDRRHLPGLPSRARLTPSAAHFGDYPPTSHDRPCLPSQAIAAEHASEIKPAQNQERPRAALIERR
ncbi:hypothetical protein ACVWWR_002519 [Bradyrhizobium sp. LM3.2]